MLTVVRRGTANARNWEGDYADAAVARHQIGPCDLKWLKITEDNESGEILTMLGQVTAPVSDDVLATDRIEVPGYTDEFAIDGTVTVTPNGFTGWASGKRFRIAKDGAHGVRQ
ncbi:hypothetical protein ACFXG4_03585 [Nocardia sp. NPDC059246]|uniref:hypothetical protein n=1 Tax=unclassified Nocardia TaxID=2637762 RepID=UPI00369E37D2